MDPSGSVQIFPLYISFINFHLRSYIFLLDENTKMGLFFVNQNLKKCIWISFTYHLKGCCSIQTCFWRQTMLSAAPWCQRTSTAGLCKRMSLVKTPWIHLDNFLSCVYIFCKRNILKGHFKHWIWTTKTALISSPGPRSKFWAHRSDLCIFSLLYGMLQVM